MDDLPQLGGMITARGRAIAEQLAASDPSVSAFVEASAGSGKTKLLTDRILRLMLAGADPAKIQCLTFTKAAAAEMALRLQDRLGQWAVLDDDALDRELLALRAPAGEAARGNARALFARVLDLAGGMRIGTIHAFCQSLLRRFPLEAKITPHFRLAEDTDARLTMDRARESVLAAADPAALHDLAAIAKAEQFGQLVFTLDGQRERIAALLELAPAEIAGAVRRLAGARAESEATLLSDAVTWPEQDALREALRLALAHGSEAMRAHAAGMLDLMALPSPQRAERWDDWVEALLTQKGEPRKQAAFAGKALAAKHPEIYEAVAAEQARVLGIERDRRAVRTASATLALLDLALPILRAYGQRKDDLGLLDYSDLIGRTSVLLRDPGAAWVLYKLDGGIDHLLLDEVQDTAPEQWRIAHLLTDEFFAGLGARPDAEAPGRTFFAVGDPKQSIYSFQGADRDEFTRSRAAMAYRVGGSGERWLNVALDVSFRSTAPVLELVDAVFAGPPASVGVVEGTLQHFADRAGHAGRVELWPLAPVPEPPQTRPWTVPPRNLGLGSAPQMLAEAVAGWIAEAIERGEALPSRGRALAAGDVLVLVRRRTDFARNVVRALKARGVPVAGLDRLVLTEQAAVQDVLAACDAVLLPGDDLAVGCVLTSPLGGLSQDSLMDLAVERGSTLWDALRTRAAERPDWTAAWSFLSSLAARADHVTPHALLAEALGRLGGRARLLARLGPEAAEPLDELLGAALDYTALHPPSLQGFVHWLRRSGATIKREAGGAGGAVRVMTVHGAKGLQAPLVILPDTTALPPEDEPFTWADDAETGAAIPLWSPRKEFRCEAVDRMRVADRARQMQEYNRLLYVGLTRAEDRLIVCGWQTRRGVPDESWYKLVAKGFATLGARSEPGPSGEPMQVIDCPQTRPPAASGPEQVEAPVPLPGWAGRPGAWQPAPPPPERLRPIPLVPSRPDDVTLGPVPQAISPRPLSAQGGSLDRFRRGTLVHELLQHLPAIEPTRWDTAARAYLDRRDAEDAGRLAEETLAVLRHPDLADLFGPHSRAEQPITGLVGRSVITGKVDRLAVLPGVVLLADYKTGRDAPADVASTPVLYLRQLASYRAVLQAIYPDREVRCLLIWTHGPTIADLPPALLDAHAPGAWGPA